MLRGTRWDGGSMALHPLYPFRGAWDARGGRGVGFDGMGVRWPPPAIEGAGAWGRFPPPTTTRASRRDARGGRFPSLSQRTPASAGGRGRMGHIAVNMRKPS
ncbi:hypothetical protein COCOBI_pt-1080 (chloroplast) [Coccomyxa sp. Obi]|nr:hypothetical protein COCOBI_pt-1080 [Coccomyxa sp. Obi]